MCVCVGGIDIGSLVIMLEGRKRLVGYKVLVKGERYRLCVLVLHLYLCILVWVWHPKSMASVGPKYPGSSDVWTHPIRLKAVLTDPKYGDIVKNFIP